jgi:hypothetical protein
MIRSFLVLGVTLAAALPAQADLQHRLSSSVQIDVGAASTRAVRLSNSYSISGSGIDTSVTAGGSTTSDALGGLGAATNGVNAITVPDVTQKTAGSAFTYSVGYSAGDTVPTSAPTVGEVPAFGDVTSTAGGTVDNAAATINTSGAVTLTPGGANTSVTGQVISEINMR